MDKNKKKIDMQLSLGWSSRDVAPVFMVMWFF